MRHVATTVPTKAHALGRQSDRTVLVVAATAAVAVHVLSLELVLNALAVGRVPDQGQDRPDAFHEQRPLTGFRVVEGSLDDNGWILDEHEASNARRTCTQ